MYVLGHFGVPLESFETFEGFLRTVAVSLKILLLVPSTSTANLRQEELALKYCEHQFWAKKTIVALGTSTKVQISNSMSYIT
jgi:hypothetical protein